MDSRNAGAAAREPAPEATPIVDDVECFVTPIGPRSFQPAWADADADDSEATGV